MPILEKSVASSRLRIRSYAFTSTSFFLTVLTFLTPPEVLVENTVTPLICFVAQPSQEMLADADDGQVLMYPVDGKMTVFIVLDGRLVPIKSALKVLEQTVLKSGSNSEVFDAAHVVGVPE